MKLNFQLHYWPVLLIGWFFITVTISYIVAVAENNVHPLFPYISELGAWKPSSSVFGQLINIGALLTAITAYIRYQQVNFAIDSSKCNLSKKWNEISFWLGLVVALGLSFVGNFQADFKGNYGVLGMHFIGASMTFGIGGIYISIQIIITFGLRPYYKKYPEFGVSLIIQYVRLISTILFFVDMLPGLVFAVAASRASNDNRWQVFIPGDDGYSFHIISVISEWLLVILFLLNLLTVKNEFKAISFQGIHFKRASMKEYISKERV